MSINITVHGKPLKSVKNNILEDPVRVNREQQNERRKLRLQQVRQESNKIAKKIRKKVEREKINQLNNIEKTKTREMDNWRRNVISQNRDDHCSAIFQIGEAHRAAQKENERDRKTNSNVPLRRTNIDPSAKSNKENENIKILPSKVNTATSAMSIKKLSLKNAEIQTDSFLCIPISSCTNLNSNKTRRSDSSSSNESHQYLPSCESYESSTTEETEEEETEEEGTTNFSYSTNQDTEKPSIKSKTTQESNNKEKTFKKSSFGIHVISSDELSPPEIEDMYTSSNLKSSSVSNTLPNKTKPVSSKKSSDHNVKSTMNRNRPNTTTSKSSSNQKKIIEKSRTISKKGTNFISQPVTSPNKATTPSRSRSTSAKRYPSPTSKSHSTTSGPRFTQISDLVKKCRENENKSPEKKGLSRSPSPAKKKFQLNVKKSASKSMSPSKKSGTKTSLASTEGNKVQFYDHLNKFQKEYTSEINVHHLGPDIEHSHLNANQQAIIENQLQEVHRRQAEKLKERAEIRGQNALEKEQIRRDYEALNHKLSTLTQQNPAIDNDPILLSDIQLKQTSINTQNKLSKAVEKAIQQPIIITCPEIDEEKTKKKSFNTIPAINVNMLANEELNNSSNSCCSILLDYINNQSQQISDDIKKNNYSVEKVNKLKNLLQQLKTLQNQLELEIQKCQNKKDIDEMQFQNVVDSISDMRKERENILISDTEENLLKHREKLLKKKEAILEKKLKEFYEMQRKKFKNQPDELEVEIDNISSSSGVEILKENCNKPMEIVIKLRKKDKKKKIYKTPTKSPRKITSSLISPMPIKKRKEPIQHTPARKVTKTFIKSKEKEYIDIDIDNDNDDDNSQGTGSTSYKSPPEKVQTPLDKILIECSKEKLSKQCSNDKDEEKEEATKNIVNIIRNFNDDPKTCNLKSKETQTKGYQISSRRRPLHPILIHYIKQLLGMSRNSIKSLNITSSDISTPSSSIMNTSGNLCGNEEQLKKVEKLKEFVEDNQNFINQIENSLKNESTNCETIGIVKPKEKNEAKTLIKPNTSNKLVSILKNNSTSSEQTLENTIENIPKQLKVRNQYSNLTENCQQRISDLNDMINQVRIEKQKVLEMSLSSTSEKDRTEYIDCTLPKSNCTPVLPPCKTSNAPNIQKSIEDIPQSANLEKNKLTGYSRDSGISSRPATALELPDSPEVLDRHLRSKSPLNIPCSNPQKVNEQPRQELSTIAEADTTINSKTAQSVDCHTISINKNYPQETSDIVRISPKQPQTQFATGESPVRPDCMEKNCEEECVVNVINYSGELIKPTEGHKEKEASNQNISNSNESCKLNTASKIKYKQFPTYEEYAKLNNLSFENMNSNFSSQILKEFETLVKLIESRLCIQYEEFPTINTYLNVKKGVNFTESFEELIQSLKVINLTTKKFPSLHEYLKNDDDVISLIDTLSLLNTELDKQTSDNQGDDDTFLDINKELIKRNILSEPFKNSKIPNKCLSKNQINDISDSDLFLSESSNHVNIEKELDQMGLKWANSMLKKAQESQALSSTTLSSDNYVPTRKKTPRKKFDPPLFQKIDSSNSVSSNLSSSSLLQGQPLNLRAFLTKELQKRTNSSSSASLNTSNDSSMAGLFVRSILNCLASTHVNDPNVEVQKTSTPVQSNSSKSSKTSRTSKLFSGESHISSVQYENTMNDMCSKKQ